VKSACQGSTDPAVSSTAQQVAWLTVFAVKDLPETGLVPVKLDGREPNVLFVMMDITVISVRIPALSLVSLMEFALMGSMVPEFACLARLNSLEITASCAMLKITMEANVNTPARIFV